MKKINATSFSILMVLASVTGFAQTISDIELTNSVTAKPVSLSSLPSKTVVVIFFSNTCPFDKYYLDRIKSLEAEYGNKVSFVLINSSLEESENASNMNVFAKANNISIPYLADKEQLAANQLTPRKTPEAFLLQSSGGKFTVMYKGSIDDNPQVASDATRFYLKEAIDNALSGKKIEVKDIRPVGCSIKRN
jgi:thiol-disulfide isomerase/thioredoxin